MPSIHLIERMNNVRKMPQSSNEWESGHWVLAEDSAARLVGGDLYLHSGQDDASHFGGKILGYRIHSGGAEDGRIVFRIRAAMEYKGVRTDRSGWGNEKKLVW